MKKILAFAVLALAGCGSVAPGVVETDIYTPPMFALIGTVRRVEDTSNGVVLYYVTDADHTVLLFATKNGKDVTPPDKP